MLLGRFFTLLVTLIMFCSLQSLEEVFTYNLDLAIKNQSDAKRSCINDRTPFSQRVRSALVEEEEVCILGAEIFTE